MVHYVPGSDYMVCRKRMVEFLLNGGLLSIGSSTMVLKRVPLGCRLPAFFLFKKNLNTFGEQFLSETSA